MNKSMTGVMAVAVLLAVAAGGWWLVQDTGQQTDARDQGATSDMDSMPRYQAGDFEVAVTIDPDTARVGDNRLMLEIRDADGRPVPGLAVDAYAQMPAMGAMAAMRAPAGLEQVGPGRFVGNLELAMRGEWPLTVLISDPVRGDRRLQFELATDRQGLAIASGGRLIGGRLSAVDAAADQGITIDNRRRQLIGLETGSASHRDLARTIRAVGRVLVDERRLHDVALKYDGYIGDLHANFVGAQVVKGEVLFTVYSPELLAAQQEYLEARARRGSGQQGLLAAARQRLLLWDIADQDIARLEASGTPLQYLPWRAAQAGTVLARHTVAGSAVMRGVSLLTLADLSRVWVEAEVYAEDLSLLAVGMAARVTLPYLPSESFAAQVEFIQPVLDGRSRTGRLRLSLANPDGVLKPDMFAEVQLQVALGHVLSVPQAAVLVAGDQRVVFVDLGAGRLRPARVQLGRSADGYVEVLGGLALGDVVVTSGNFLVAAETRLRTGLEQW